MTLIEFIFHYDYIFLQQKIIQMKSSLHLITHTLNNSKSKQSHSFGKSPRFTHPFQSPCMQSSYDLTNSAVVLSNRTQNKSKFGRESRFYETSKQIMRRSLSPSPNAYHNIGFLQKSINQNKGSRFGNNSRMTNKKSNVPGPGTYNSNVYNPEANLSYSMRNKPKKGEAHWNKVGPGQYSAHEGTIMNSIKKLSYKLGQDQRFKKRASETPAPGTYNVDGRIVTEPTSKYTNNGRYTFGKQVRKNKRSNNPGPGTYNIFSEFIN